MNEALRLADYMDDALNDPNDVADAVSAELRRLAAVEAQRDALLEALKGVLRVADRKTDEFDAARAAIAKAEGEKS